LYGRRSACHRFVAVGRLPAFPLWPLTAKNQPDPKKNRRHFLHSVVDCHIMNRHTLPPALLGLATAFLLTACASAPKQDSHLYPPELTSQQPFIAAEVRSQMQIVLKVGDSRDQALAILGPPTYTLKPRAPFAVYDEQWTYFPKTNSDAYRYIFFKDGKIADIRYDSIRITPTP
jgi:hypothetical protein